MPKKADETQQSTIEVGEDYTKDEPLEQVQHGDPNSDFRWCNTRLLEKRKRQGWQPVTPQEVKTYYPTEEGQSPDTTVRFWDVTLCKRRKEIGETRRAKQQSVNQERMRQVNDWQEKASDALRSGSERKIAESLEEFSYLTRNK